MAASNTFGDILSTLFDRRPFGRRAKDGRPIRELCDALLAGKSEVSAIQLASIILDRFQSLEDGDKRQFFNYLNDELEQDPEEIARLALAYSEDRTPGNFRALCGASEPKRQELLRRLNQAPGATGDLVQMRRELLIHLKEDPDLARTDHDFVHLLKSWFNRGFLVLRQITWNSPAAILEKIIAYEAVHEIQNWEDLRRRLHPSDRRCFAFFHPSMPDEPLIFVEVALTKGVPGSIQDVLADARDVQDETDIDTAVFYSISNCQAGLAGISFGNSLIKQVARDLGHELPGIKTFVTLSPIPGLSRWMGDETPSSSSNGSDQTRRLAAHYLLNAKSKTGSPLDPVARFHLANGAMIHNIHADADLSENGLSQSMGAMVNYLYDPQRIAQNMASFAEKQSISAASSVKTLARQGAKAKKN